MRADFDPISKVPCIYCLIRSADSAVMGCTLGFAALLLISLSVCFAAGAHCNARGKPIWCVPENHKLLAKKGEAVFSELRTYFTSCCSY